MWSTMLAQLVCLRMNQKYLADVGLLLYVKVTEVCCTHQLSTTASFYIHLF